MAVLLLLQLAAGRAGSLSAQAPPDTLEVFALRQALKFLEPGADFRIGIDSVPTPPSGQRATRPESRQQALLTAFAAVPVSLRETERCLLTADCPSPDVDIVVGLSLPVRDGSDFRVRLDILFIKNGRDKPSGTKLSSRRTGLSRAGVDLRVRPQGARWDAEIVSVRRT